MSGDREYFYYNCGENYIELKNIKNIESFKIICNKYRNSNSLENRLGRETNEEFWRNNRHSIRKDFIEFKDKDIIINENDYIVYYLISCRSLKIKSEWEKRLIKANSAKEASNMLYEVLSKTYNKNDYTIFMGASLQANLPRMKDYLGIIGNHKVK